MQRVENSQVSASDLKENISTNSESEISQKGLGTYLTVTAIGFIIALLLGAIFDVLAGVPTGNTANEQIASQAKTLTFYNLARLCDACLPLFLLALTAGVGLFVKTVPSLKYLSRVGVLFMSVYAPISVVVYVAQYTFLSIMLKEASTRSTLWPLWSVGIWPMSYLAYAISGIGLLLIAVELVNGRGARRWGGWSLILTGILFFLAFAIQVQVGLGFALPLLWLGGLAGVSFAVAMIVYARQMGHAARQG